MENKIGILYKIINNVNGKLYIGQTSIDEKIKERGSLRRFKQHIYCAIKKKNKCIILENAIRKYGENNFSIETILYCDLNNLNNYEINLIKLYDSTNKKNGYNISQGGSGCSGHMTEKKRKNISKGQNGKNMGIISKYRKNVIVGYRAQRKQGGIKYEKLFSDQSISLEENYKLAQKYLEDVKNNNLDQYKLFNRKDDLPKNILFEKDQNGKIIGYRFQIKINKNSYCKVESSKDKSLEEKFVVISNEKLKFENITNNYKNRNISQIELDKLLETYKSTSRKYNLPKNIMYEYKHGEKVGYRFQIKINKKVIAKVFKNHDESMEIKLKKVLEYRDNFVKNNNNDNNNLQPSP